MLNVSYPLLYITYHHYKYFYSQKEEISRGKGVGKRPIKEAFVENDIDNPQEETSEDALKQLDQFDKDKYGDESDSD